MKNNRYWWILAGAGSCWVVCIGQVATDYWFGAHYPGYHWMSESLSALGEVGSPVKDFVSVWGVLFSALFALFSRGFYAAFSTRGVWAKWAAVMILVYGLGEGAGSGLVPVDPSAQGMGSATFLHIVLSMIGDTGLFLLPLVMIKIFPRPDFPGFFAYSWLVLILGFSFSILFTLTKIYPSDTGILHYRGVWQRLYTLVFHLYLISISVKMLQQSKLK